MGENQQPKEKKKAETGKRYITKEYTYPGCIRNFNKSVGNGKTQENKLNRSLK